MPDIARHALIGSEGQCRAAKVRAVVDRSWRHFIASLIVVAGAGVAPVRTTRAQSQLPWTRSSALPAAADSVGREPRTDGGVALVPLTYGYAARDLGVFDWRIAARYPMTSDAYPLDTIVADDRARGSAWVRRVPGIASGPLMDPVFKAQLEVTAGDDAAAQQTIAMALTTAGPATAVSAGVRRSAVLALAVKSFLDEQGDDRTLTHRLGIADGYVALLEALPRAGYATMRDSLAVLDRTRDAERAALMAHYRFGHRPEVLRYADRLIVTLARYQGMERRNYITGAFPVEAIGISVLGLPEGRAKLEALRARIERLVTLSPTELASLDRGERAQVVEDVPRSIALRFRPVDALGRVVPAIAAHAWFNTEDASYGPHPRTRTFADGIIRVIFPKEGGCRQDCANLLVLDRERRGWPTGVGMLVLSVSAGHVLNDVVEPVNEIAWLDSLWIQEEHLAMPIAVWAGEKGPAAFDGRRPAPWPLRDYPWPPAAAVIVDGGGIVRGYAEVYSHRDEAALDRCVLYLAAEAAGKSAGLALPPELVPATTATNGR